MYEIYFLYRRIQDAKKKLRFDQKKVTNPSIIFPLSKKHPNKRKRFNPFFVAAQDCVSVFSENSARWLIAEQGIMKAGGCNAVRGATAPVSELRSVLVFHFILSPRDQDETSSDTFTGIVMSKLLCIRQF